MKRLGKNSGTRGSEKQVLLQSQVSNAVCEVLGNQAGVGADTPLTDAGLDSLGAVELRNALARLVGMDLPGTLVFDYPSMLSLSGYLVNQQASAADKYSTYKYEDSYDSSARKYSLLSESEGDSSVVIFSALCDGSVGSVGLQMDASTTVDGVNPVPYLRWNVDIDDDLVKLLGKQQVRFSGFMQDVDLWDAQSFGISPSESVQTDPQQRMLMLRAFTVLTQGGETLASVKGMNRCMLLGICHAEYAGMLTRAGTQIAPYTSLAGALSVACGRISYIFGFNGPCASLDTACSSSLVSTHISSRMIKGTECASGIAGGVSTSLQAYGHVLFQVSGMLAPDSRCKTLDVAGDGWMRPGD